MSTIILLSPLCIESLPRSVSLLDSALGNWQDKGGPLRSPSGLRLMPQTVLSCPACHADLKLKPNVDVPKQVKCPKCGVSFATSGTIKTPTTKVRESPETYVAPEAT